jgi:hypothetical protein
MLKQLIVFRSKLVFSFLSSLKLWAFKVDNQEAKNKNDKKDEKGDNQP